MGGSGRAKRAIPTHDDGTVMNGAPGFYAECGWVRRRRVRGGGGRCGRRAGRFRGLRGKLPG
jgi:hypothetical protein